MLATNTLRGGGHTFGRARNFSPVPDESRRCLRNRLARLAAIIAYVRKLALARLVAAFVRVFQQRYPLRTASQIISGVVDRALARQTITDPRRLLPARCIDKPRIDTSPIVKAAERKTMVIQVPTADIQPNSHTIPVAANGLRVWASATYEQAAQTIDTKHSAAILSAARANNSPFLIDPNRIKQH